ncbi:MAG: hypothetical protein KJO35_11070, partial [Gammaproteobacteria bacterium]|nr:hypothetical protein [Gammaproteobacteria bacterium]
MSSLISELRRRNVLKMAAAYAVVAWILIESGSVLLPTFGAPEWFFKAWVLVIIGGFLLSLTLAWIFEWTPEGVKLEKDVDRSESITHETGRRLNFSIIGLLLVALSISLVLNFTGMRAGESQSARAEIGSSIAVLPFSSISTDPDNELFTDGIHDDLLTSLASIQSLKVISRTSVLEYRGTTRNLRNIARELGVETVLERSVQRVGDNIRINVQLIDALTDEHIWAERYDKKLTAKNIFQIQSEISETITSALRAKLTPEEQDRLELIPTENMQAYSLVTAARSNLNKRQLETLRFARGQFQQAIELDPKYSQAHSGLADSILLLMINHNAVAREEAIVQASQSLETALALDPNNATAYASLGLLKINTAHHENNDALLAEAESAFLRAIELSPGHAETYSWYASLKDEQGDRDKAISLYQKSLELDPLARIPRSNLAAIYAKKGKNELALEHWLEGVRINPEWPAAYDYVANQLLGLGRLDEAYAWATRAEALSDDPQTAQALYGVLLLFDEPAAAQAILRKTKEGHPLFNIVDGYEKFVAEDYAGALASWEQANAAGLVTKKEYILQPAADSALMIGNDTKALDYTLQLAPELANGDIKFSLHNTKNALRYAFLLQRSDPSN